MDVVLTVSKSDVLLEVARATGYVGSKKNDDANAYERIGTIDEDKDELQRFWDESRTELVDMFTRVLTFEGEDPDDTTGDTYKLVLNVSVAFDQVLVEGMQLGLHNYFVQNITAKWFVVTNKEEAEDYAKRAMAALTALKKEALHKKLPVRPTYD